MLQYREGITDFTTVLTAEQNLLQQQDALAVSRGEIPSSLIRTYRALGGGWEIREDKSWCRRRSEAMRNRTNWGGLLSGIDRARQPAGALGFLPAPNW